MKTSLWYHVINKVLLLLLILILISKQHAVQCEEEKSLHIFSDIHNIYHGYIFTRILQHCWGHFSQDLNNNNNNNTEIEETGPHDEGETHSGPGDMV